MDFEAYLISKKIDPAAFIKAEPDLFKTWKHDFQQMHPKSFTVQKLNLINPIRRKYLLKETVVNASEKAVNAPAPTATPKPKPVIKPKFN